MPQQRHCPNKPSASPQEGPFPAPSFPWDHFCCQSHHEGDMSSLCVSQADDCRLLGKLPKVKCLRNGRREGKSCRPTTRVGNPDFGRCKSDGMVGDLSGVVDKGGQQVLGTGALIKGDVIKGWDLKWIPPLFLKKMGLLRYPMRLSCSLLARKLEQPKQSPGSYF